MTLHWLTTILAYAHHPQVTYGIEVTDGEPVDSGRLPDYPI
jgi:hypothetical protein